MVEGGMKCVKYLLFAFNLIFFLAGLGLIIAGALVQTQFQTYFALLGSGINGAAILLIVVGCIVFVIGFFGCCGAYKENYCMVMTFAVLLGIIFLLEIAAGVTAYVMKGQVSNFLQKELDMQMMNYRFAGEVNNAVTLAWNKAQEEFQCCGVSGYKDWSRVNGSMGVNTPDSCCDTSKASMEGCGQGQITVGDKIYTRGCLDEFVKWFNDNIYIIGGVGIGLAFVQIVGIVLACCLARTIRKEYDVV